VPDDNFAELDEFARFYGFHYDLIDGEVLIRDCLNDMERGLRGLPSDVPMRPSYISPAGALPPGKTVVALDAGGTNLRASRVVFDEKGVPEVTETRKGVMPGTHGAVSAEGFFDEIAALCAPLFAAGDISGIGFCFSYPMDLSADGEGRPVMFSKEIDAPEVVGKPVGRSLREALARRGVKAPEKIALLNDTVSTLLTGITSIPSRYPSKLAGLYADALPNDDKCGVAAGPVIGMILGTGFNTAYPEVCIPKIGYHAADGEAQVVVCESGNYFSGYQGRLDHEYDLTTKNPGAYTTEKLCGGAYLGPLALTVFKQAIKDGLLKFRRQDELAAMPALAARDLNAFLHAPLSLQGPLGSLFGKDENSAISALLFLSGLLAERAGLFAAVAAAGTALHIDAGSDPNRPVRFAVEGTTYLVFGCLRRAFEARLHQLLNENGLRSYIVSPVDQASLLGAAVAALV